MKKFSPEQNKWIMMGALFAVLGFNLSIHHFEKDEHGFAVIDPRQSESYQGSGFFGNKFAAENNSGVFELAEKLPPPTSQVDAKEKAPESAADPKKEEDKSQSDTKVQKDFVFNNGKKGTIEYTKLKGGNTLAAITETECDCTKYKVLEVPFNKDLSELEKALRTSTAAAAKEAPVVAKGKSVTKVDVADAEDTTTVEDPKITAKKAKAEKIRKIQAAKFAAILKECAAESDKAAEVDCNAKGLLQLMKDNKDESKDLKIADKAFEEFYAQNISEDMINLIVNSEDKTMGSTKDMSAGLKVAQRLIAELPKSMNNVRTEVLNVESGIVRNMGADYQSLKRQEQSYKQTHQNYIQDPVYTNLVEQSNQSLQQSNYMSWMMNRNTALGLNAGIQKGNMDYQQATRTMSTFRSQMTRINDGLLNPLDQRYALQAAPVGADSLMFMNSLGGDNGLQIPGLINLNSSTNTSNNFQDMGSRTFRLSDATQARSNLVTQPTGTLFSNQATLNSNGVTVLQPSNGSVLGSQNLNTTSNGITFNNQNQNLNGFNNNQFNNGPRNGFQQQNGLMQQNGLQQQNGFQQQNGMMNQNQGFQNGQTLQNTQGFQNNGGTLRRANGSSLGLQ